MKWQPIETAPEHNYFLVCNCNASDVDATVAVVWNDNNGGLIIEVDQADRELPYRDGPATHWMPLPEPPK